MGLKTRNDKKLTVMDFTGIYQLEKFYCHENIEWIDCQDIEGTHGYCSDEAKAKIKERIKNSGVNGLHFIDSGNFHYVSEFWLEKLNEEFILVVFDHHSDMLKPLFGDILSCGSWILNALEHNHYLQKVVLIGIAKEQVALIDQKYQDKIIYFTNLDLGDLKNWYDVSILLEQYPIYISIDKDVLSSNQVVTDWQQGEMYLLELKLFLADLIKQGHVLGIDVCGECSKEVAKLSDIKSNDELNYQILEFLKGELINNV